jgi:hypothetical protein
MAPCQLFRLQKRARRNDPNSLKGMQCKQVRIAGHNVSRLAAYSERKKLVILRIAAGGYLHIDRRDVHPNRLCVSSGMVPSGPPVSHTEPSRSCLHLQWNLVRPLSLTEELRLCQNIEHYQLSI